MLEQGAPAQHPANPAEAPAASPAEAPRRRLTPRRAILGALLLVLVAGALAFPFRHHVTAQGADLMRRLIGDENTARVESLYFRAEDRLDRLKYRLFGSEENPFAATEAAAEASGESLEAFAPQPPPAGAQGPDLANLPAFAHEIRIPINPPQTHLLQEKPASGEGAWTSAGLPGASPTEPLMLRTFIRPDRARPYSTVGVLLVDSRRIRLHLRGGTEDPGGDRGVRGTGTIPQEERATLLAAWNGGFKGPHGGFGMVADGKTYRPLRNGLATVAVYKDGTIKMGEWGTDLAWDDSIVAARQNAVLLVKDGEVSRRTSEGNDTWGYVQVNSSEFITWRSAVGLTKDGNLIVASGNSLSAATLAQALWAAGAHTAMQLDINTPYVLTSLLFPQPDGTIKAQRFMDSMPDAASRFLKTQERDFMYLTLEESRYR